MSREIKPKALQMMKDPPAIHLWGIFAGDKWDHECARNVLIHFIKRQRLDKKCVKWLEKNFPSDRDRD